MRYKLRSLRISNGFTQQNIASKLNISRAFYTKLELGKSNPSFKLAIKIKEVFNYKDDDIFENYMCQKGTKNYEIA